ncbi:MAG: MBL fold metallo-hydrolase [Dokdonella sp.]
MKAWTCDRKSTACWAKWAAAHGKAVPTLVVMHSHRHRDHTGGDAQLTDRPDTTIVGLELADIAAFFGIEDWPNQVGSIDLGGRKLQIVPTPGHADSHVMVFDPTTRSCSAEMRSIRAGSSTNARARRHTKPA